MDTNSKDLLPENKVHGQPRPNHLRRRSRNGTPKDRHGIIFSDQAGSTVRAVTPEPVEPIENTQSSPRTSRLSSPTGNPSRRGIVGSPPELPGSISNTDEESTLASRRRRNRVKAAIFDDINVDPSATSFITKTKKRLGSITGGVLPIPHVEEPPVSTGFPSIVPPFPIPGHQEERYNSTPLRPPFSPGLVSSFTPQSVRSPGWLDHDATKILQLMKTTCGRMHGILYFRPIHTLSWSCGWCAVNVAPGSLVCQVKGEALQTKTLIPDLRGCIVRTHYDVEIQSTYLSVLIPSTGTGYQLRPTVAETFDSWLAALLCWQPLRPRGLHNKMTKPQSVVITDRRPVGQRRLSDAGTQKSHAIIKVGKMTLWDGPLPSGSQSLVYQHRAASNIRSEEVSLWRRVSCTLHENGTFRLLEEYDARVLSTISLSQLSRSAVQRLDESVLNKSNCIAIYPQYTAYTTTLKQQRPMILCLESRVAFEAWFVLLRALTVPELYGPEQKAPSLQSDDSNSSKSMQSFSNTGMFRIERSLTIKVIEAKFTQQCFERDLHDHHANKKKPERTDSSNADVYVDVVCGQHLRARTAIKTSAASVFWSDEFTIRDIPSNLNRLGVILRMVNPGEREWTMVALGPYDISADVGYLSGLGGAEITTHDSILGKVDIQMDDLEQQVVIDKWWPILDNNDQNLGQMLMRVALQESVVLMQDDYMQLSGMLQTFSTNVTIQVARTLGQELKNLSEVLLDYYQATDQVHEWITYLIEEEIDGANRDSASARPRFGNRLRSNEGYESAEQRELAVRDLSRSATMEANLLFRGNSLVTKALDAHMRRLGCEYLSDVLGPRLRRIIDRDPDCEVDPIKVKNTDQLERNWVNLIHQTSEMWKAISASANQCPPSLRGLFKHIRSYAEDRYGSFIRTVKYTSVSGFLFLRFFCPAILNPKMFGILPDHPQDRPKRTFTLIAKSLNVLANMAKFGTKEPWMEPMNKFLAGSTSEFKAFIDDICAINSSELPSSAIEPQYATPNQIKGRLPVSAREGLPSLPFLLDSSKLLADLVDLWMVHAPNNLLESSSEEPLKAFHRLCKELQRKTKECLSRAEQAEKPDSKLEMKWQQILSEQHKARNLFEEQFMPHASQVRSSAAAQTSPQLPFEQRSEGYPEISSPSSSASAAWDKQGKAPHQPGENRIVPSPSNSSVDSFEVYDDAPSMPLPTSRDSPSTNTIAQLLGSPGRRNGR